jgi:thiosulfate/3-mercaptopyruvate sulfurtransferase
MKVVRLISGFAGLALLTLTFSCSSPSGGEAWTEAQLLDPAALAKVISDSAAAKPVILSIGPAGLIKGAQDIGPVSDPAGIENLKSAVAGIPKDKEIVLYCGCCPYANCPNVRPGMNTLKELGFTNYKLLDLPENLRVDWIAKGFPMQE